MSKTNDYLHLIDEVEKIERNYSFTTSVVITSYNMFNVLEKTLSGLTYQTYPRELIEVIVSDDGSSDQVESLLPKFKDKFANLVFVKQTDQGYRLASARNNGISVARGEIIVSLDGDVFPPPQLIEEHLKWFHTKSKVSTIGYLHYVDTANLSAKQLSSLSEEDLKKYQIKSLSNWNQQDDRRLPEFEDFHTHPAPYNCFHGGNVAFSRKTALEIGLFDEDFDGNWGYEDLEFGYRLWKHGAYLIPCKEALGFHQERASTLTFAEKRCQRNINFEKICSKVPGFREFRQKLGR